MDRLGFLPPTEPRAEVTAGECQHWARQAIRQKKSTFVQLKYTKTLQSRGPEPPP